MDVQVDLLSEPLVAEVAGEGPLLVVHQTLVLVQHRLLFGRYCKLILKSSQQLQHGLCILR